LNHILVQAIALESAELTAERRNPESSESSAIQWAAQLFCVAIWFGLATGLAEVFVLVVKKYSLNQIIWFSRDLAWMAPLADTFLFILVAACLFVAGQAWAKLRSPRIITIVFAFLAFLSLFLLVPILHNSANLVLAIGLAIQLSRVAAARDYRFHSWARRTIPLMTGVFLVLAGGSLGWRVIVERRALASIPAAPAGAPNVLLITLDTVRAESLSLYGYSRPTSPQLERLATAGVRFDNALTTAPWTLPSHASMLTGRFPHELSIGWTTPLDGKYPTLAEVLSERGYETAGFVANSTYCTYESGLSRGFAHYEDCPISFGEIVFSSSLGRSIANNHSIRRVVGYYDILGRKTAEELNRDFFDWLSSRKVQRPFFAFLNYFDAHEPYLPPQPFYDEFRSSNEPRKNWLIRHSLRDGERSNKREMSAEEIKIENDAYDASISYIDHHLGLLIDTLSDRGLLGNTLVIITADHGELFGEHGLFTHGNSLYIQSLHVPLLISFPPRVPAGRIVAEPVSLAELPATIVDLLKIDGECPFPGKSLAHCWNHPPEEGITGAAPLLSELIRAADLPASYPASIGDMKSLVFDRYHYIRNGDGGEELYDLVSDTAELDDLTKSNQGRLLLDRLRQSLTTILATQH